jgi:hypothetical protein
MEDEVPVWELLTILKGSDQMGAYSLLSGGGGASISTTEESALETCATDPRASVFS